MSTVTSVANSSGMVRARRWPVWLALVAAMFGLSLLALNLYGLTQPLRGPAVATEVPGRMYEPPLTKDQAVARLRALSAGDPRAYALQVGEVVGQSMSHIDWRQPTSSEVESYRLTVPVWENYLLFALRYVRPDTYRVYELCSWRRAMDRGVGQCGQKSLTLIGYLAEQGFRTGIVYLTGHVVMTVEVAPGEWYVLDPDFRAYMPHDLDTLVARPELLRAAYAHNQKGLDALESMYLSRPARVILGGPHVRYPKGCVLEEVAYVAKWALPVGALVFAAGLFLFARRRSPAA